MTVTISDYHGYPGPSYGKVTLSQLEDTVAFDMGTSRQYTISSHYGYFDVRYALINNPDVNDWWTYASEGMNDEGQRVSRAGRSYEGNTVALRSTGRVVFGIAKWIRFTLKAGDVSLGDRHKVPAIQFRNIKNTRIVISGESELTVRSTAPSSIDIPYSTTTTIPYDTLNRTWFSGDYLTRYTATSADEDVVVASLVRRPIPNSSPGALGNNYQIALRASGQVHTTTTVTVQALDAANNRVSHTVTVNVTN